MEHLPRLREFTFRSAQKIGISLNEPQLNQFMLYLEHLNRWNSVTNLSGITSEKEVVVKHFIDSLTALASLEFPPNAVVFDVGSGAGFPGIPIKIVRNDLRLTLIDPAQKKCSFLNFIIGLLKLDRAAVFEGTVEDYAKEPAHLLADVIMVRALKIDSIENALSMLLSRDGKLLLFRSTSIRNQRLSHHVRFLKESAFALPEGHGKRVISILERLSAT